MEKRENEIAAVIVDAAVEVHRTLGGPGLLESVYEEAMVWELTARGIPVRRQVPLPIHYKGHPLSSPLVMDMLADERVIIENKAVAQYNALFEAQCLTYLRLTRLKLGLVINLGERWIKDGIHRVVNGL
ncbi:MAG TPA: GxxExxY protein [Candidatus Hydrogenedentes bacterium]|nr:GxxExxY protein [Candidatus Hydrogenedentota bacterium]